MASDTYFCVVIRMTVGVSSILCVFVGGRGGGGGSLQNQWPFCDKLRKEKDGFHELDNWF